MASVRMDILHSPIANNTIYLTFNGLGSDENSFRSIGNGKTVILRNGNVRRNAIVHFRENGESFTNDLEINSKLATALGLRSNFRYLVTYEAKSNLLSFAPSPTSSALTKLQNSHKPSAKSIQIGYELLSLLGIPEPGESTANVVCRTQSASVRLLVSTPSNLFDNSLRLDSATIRALRLVPGSYVSLSYNQNTKVLTFKPAKAPAAPTTSYRSSSQSSSQATYQSSNQASNQSSNRSSSRSASHPTSRSASRSSSRSSSQSASRYSSGSSTGSSSRSTPHPISQSTSRSSSRFSSRSSSRSSSQPASRSKSQSTPLYPTRSPSRSSPEPSPSPQNRTGGAT